MAHEIDETLGQGQAAGALYVRKSAWHGLGTVLTEAPSVKDALRIAKLDWEVLMEPVFTRRELSGGDEVYNEVPGARATVRGDVFRPLGIVTEKYQPLQNADAFRIMEPLVDGGLATIETCGALRHGRDVWLLVAFDLKKMAAKKDDRLIGKVFGGKDPVKPYGLLANNHAGMRRVTLQETAIRVECANMLAMAHSEHGIIGIRHTSNVEVNVIEAAKELWGDLIARYRETAEAYDALMKRFLSEAEFRAEVLDVVAPLPEEVKTAGEKARDTRAKAIRTEVTRLWTEGTGHKGDGSAWEAYQAVCEAIDHTTIFGKVKNVDARMEALQEGGRLHLLKANVMDTLLGYEVDEEAEEGLEEVAGV